MRVALFITCFNDTLYPATGRAVVTLLERLGVSVEFPMAQACCGQMHINTGYRAEALPMARRFVEVFAPYDAVVAPSASCVATVRETYGALAREADDGGLAAAVREVTPKVRELTEFLVDDLRVEDVGAYFPHRVTYHPTCHSLRSLKLGDRPLRLLSAVRGIELVELDAAEECCGFGGTFALKNADVSAAMVADKMRHVLDTRAEVLVAADNSCLTHINGAMSRLRGGVRSVHLAEVLASTEEAVRR